MIVKFYGFRFLIFFIFLLIGNLFTFAQKEITPVMPSNGASNVNVGILKWSGQEGVLYDLYLGLSANPDIYKSDLETMEIKPVVLELNKTYYWKIVEKKAGKEIRSSKIFTFSTLPITLNPSVEYKSFVDLRDYKIYWTVTIGEKEWFVQNLDYDLPNMSWYYNNTESNKVYGKLYLGQSISGNFKEICPEGWHIPTQQEWTDLINAFGGIKVAAPFLKENTDLYWRKSEKIRTNKSGFTVLPAGSRDSKPSFANIGKYTFFWTSTPNTKIQNGFYTINLGFMRDNAIFDVGDPQWSYSIRCVKDN